MTKHDSAMAMNQTRTSDRRPSVGDKALPSKILVARHMMKMVDVKDADRSMFGNTPVRNRITIWCTRSRYWAPAGCMLHRAALTGLDHKASTSRTPTENVINVLALTCSSTLYKLYIAKSMFALKMAQ